EKSYWNQPWRALSPAPNYDKLLLLLLSLWLLLLLLLLFAVVVVVVCVVAVLCPEVWPDDGCAACDVRRFPDPTQTLLSTGVSHGYLFIFRILVVDVVLFFVVVIV
ncbi:unnamed protein product, partial [Polarella glacialis]